MYRCCLSAVLLYLCLVACPAAPVASAQEAEVDLSDWGNVSKIELWTPITVLHRDGKRISGRLSEVTNSYITVAGWRDRRIRRKDIVKILVDPRNFARPPIDRRKAIVAELGVGSLSALGLGYVGANMIAGGKYERSESGRIEGRMEFTRWYAGSLIGTVVGAYLGVFQVGGRDYEIGTPGATIGGALIGGIAGGFITLTIPDDRLGPIVMPALATLGAVIGFNKSRGSRDRGGPPTALLVVDGGRAYFGMPLIRSRCDPRTGTVERAVNLICVNL